MSINYPSTVNKLKEKYYDIFIKLNDVLQDPTNEHKHWKIRTELEKSSCKEEKEMIFNICLQEAEKGNSYAQFLVSRFYNGLYVGELYENEHKSFFWAEKSHQSGNPMGTNKLGFLYIEGIGTPKNINKGWDLLQQAANKNSSQAFANLGSYYYIKYGHEDFEEIKKLYQKAINLGNVYAIHQEGERYQLQGNMEKAIENYIRASRMGMHLASADLGDIYINGLHGIKKDEEKAFYFYERALKQGVAPCLIHLSEFYFEGKIVEKDIQKSFALIRKFIHVISSPEKEDLAKEKLEKMKLEVDVWYHDIHLDILDLLLLAYYFDQNSLLFHGFIPLEIFQMIVKFAHLGKYPSYLNSIRL